MKFISVDVELDAARCEVIQLGAITLDTDNPCNYYTFSGYLYHEHEPEWDYKLNNGKTLRQYLPKDYVLWYDKLKEPAAKVIVEFALWLDVINHGKKILQWGTGDWKVITELAASHNISLPKAYCTNVKQLYQTLYQPAMKLPKKYGQYDAWCNTRTLTEIQMCEIHPHNALHDAQMCREVFNTMYQNIVKLRKIKETMYEA